MNHMPDSPRKKEKEINRTTQPLLLCMYFFQEISQGLPVVCLSPVIEAVGVTSVPPPTQGKKAVENFQIAEWKKTWPHSKLLR